MNEEHWTKIAANLLEGKKINKVRYMTEEEKDILGWSNRSLVIQLDDGNLIFPSQDDEGNGPGALFSNDEKIPVLPVI